MSARKRFVGAINSALRDRGVAEVRDAKCIAIRGPSLVVLVTPESGPPFEAHLQWTALLPQLEQRLKAADAA